MALTTADETTHGAVRAAVNANATDAETRLAALEAGATVVFRDHFLNGLTSNGDVGQTGWSFVGGGAISYTGETGHPGCVVRSTTSSSGNNTTMAATGLSNTLVDLADDFELVWKFKPAQIDANTLMRYGFAAAWNVATPSGGIYAERLDADTNWHLVTRSASTQSREDTGVAATAGWTVVILRRVDASTIGLRVGATETAARAATEVTSATNVPTGGQTFGNQILNSAAAIKTMWVDEVRLSIAGLD